MAVPVPPTAPLGFHDRRLLEYADAVVGVDEVGRGCLAGPVVVCGVCFDHIPKNPHIRDSKRLSARQRERAAVWVLDSCRAWLITEVWVELIDRLNILEATRLAMRSTALTLARPGDAVVVDHLEIGDIGAIVHSLKRADSSHFCVASASILAKVHRDRLMVELADRHRHWGWSRNKGYGTAEHRLALQRYGRSYLHRKTFRWSPVLP